MLIRYVHLMSSYYLHPAWIRGTGSIRKGTAGHEKDLCPYFGPYT